MGSPSLTRKQQVIEHNKPQLTGTNRNQQISRHFAFCACITMSKMANPRTLSAYRLETENAEQVDAHDFTGQLKRAPQ